MNKTYILLISMSILVLLLIGPIFAAQSTPQCNRKDSFKAKAYPIVNDNYIINGKTWGTIEFVKGKDMRAIANGLKPYTYYTFIYLGSLNNGNPTINPICIRSRKTSQHGGVKFNLANFDYSCMLDDPNQDMFMIIKSSDVDCSKHSILNYDTEEYLFSTMAI